MDHRKHRLLSLFLAVCTLVGCFLPAIVPLTAQADEFPNTYINTGDQRKDILNVALTQIGYTEGPNNETPYGAWYGMPNQPWCATFISWCATQADVGTHILARSAVADPGEGYFNIPYQDGAKYTPLPGDLFFTKEFEHVGFVYYVDGDYFYTVEANTNVHDPDKPKPSDVEGLYVMTNRRRTKDYYFGIPAYEGGDKAHTYVKGHDSSHPHKTYYSCTTCGDKYYTGYTAYVDSCHSCLPCQCSSAYSGYYIVDISSNFLYLRGNHSSDADVIGSIIDGEAVYVYGASPSTGWAYVNYDGKRGHLALDYLEEYYSAPNKPSAKLDKTEYILGDDSKISWDLPTNTECFLLHVYKDNELVETKQLGTARTYTLNDMAPGNYKVHVYAVNKSGASEAAVLSFTVLDVYRVSFDLRGGSNGPATQTQTRGKVMTLSKTVPTRSGYTFLGWTDDAAGQFVTYEPGDSFSSDRDVTLYAVWKNNSATLETLSIQRLPARTRYLKGDSLNTEGLTLKLLYSDGSGKLTTTGFTTAGFSSETLGTKTVTVSYDGKTATFDVQIMTYIPGDINEDRLVNRDDVMQLLWHISFPSKFPITVPADFKDDDKINRDDVMQLLWHVAFPDKFPLATEPQEEPPEETTDPSTDTTEPPTEETDPSTDTTEPPTEETDPSTDTTEPPTEETDPSTDTTEPTFEATIPPR